MPLAFAACKPGAAVFNLSGGAMGTTYSVVAIDKSNAVTQAELQGAVTQALAQVNGQMSNWDAGSEISRFNRQASTAPMAISPALQGVMQAAQDVHLASEGRFDTTMGPLIELWGFGANGRTARPSDAQIAQALAHAGHTRTLGLSAGALRKTDPQAQVYLASIGKGYGADQIGRALESFGIRDYMVEIGGDIYAAGRNPEGQPWKIGIETPVAQNRGIYDVVGLSGMGLASSGDYRNYFEEDGQRFSHVIDPVTGRPITHHTASATVLAENAMLADAWSTAMLVLGRERGLQIADAHDVAVLFIGREGKGTDAQFTSASSARYAALVG